MNLGSLGLHTHQHTIDVLCRLHRSRWFLTGVYSYLYSFPLPRLYPRTTHLDPWCRERLHTRLAWSLWGPTYQLLLSNCMHLSLFVIPFDHFETQVFHGVSYRSPRPRISWPSLKGWKSFLFFRRASPIRSSHCLRAILAWEVFRTRREHSLSLYSWHTCCW